MLIEIPDKLSFANPFIDQAVPILGLARTDANLLEVLQDFKDQLKADTKSGTALHYMLCSAVDEFKSIQNRGQLALMSQSNLHYLMHFHHDNLGGVKFFEHLNEFLKEPKQHALAIEFAYMLMVLGFEGQYRLKENGAREYKQLCLEIQNILNEVLPRKNRPTYLRKRHRYTWTWHSWLIAILIISSLCFYTIQNIRLYYLAKPTATMIHQVTTGDTP